MANEVDGYRSNDYREKANRRQSDNSKSFYAGAKRAEKGASSPAGDLKGVQGKRGTQSGKSGDGGRLNPMGELRKAVNDLFDRQTTDSNNK